ncbi:hypothetical protein [Nocardia brevicatena]|uniref:hypothetical protein n=1 Tax=Nocardia brevicatena TaxID=37327 RepID=UPI00059320D9|nr:hypothetical protein [Nocardia brevicatena]
MWHWSTRVAEHARAAAFTRVEYEPEPTVTEPEFAVETDEDRHDDGNGLVCRAGESEAMPIGYALAG